MQPPSHQQPMDVFERVLQGVLRDSAHGDRLALALPLLARARRTDQNYAFPNQISSDPTNPFLPSNRRTEGSSHRRSLPPRSLSPLNQSNDHTSIGRPLPDLAFQPLATIPQQLQSLSSASGVLPSASKLLEHVSLSKLDHTLAAASQQVDETTAALALAWGNEWSSTVSAVADVAFSRSCCIPWRSRLHRCAVRCTTISPIASPASRCRARRPSCHPSKSLQRCCLARRRP
jgi:hypothetical protein